MEVIDISKGGTPKDWEPEKLLSSFRAKLAHFSKSLSPEKVAALEKSVASLIKPVNVVKFGLVIESKNAFANPVMFSEVVGLLAHGSPVIVNREFMLAWRALFVNVQIPLEWYHQMEGELTLIIPEGAGNPEILGFNEKELIQGTFKELPPLKNSEIDQALNRLLVKETSDRKFARIGMIIGHGSEGSIAQLSPQDFSKVQHTLHSKGMLFGALSSCHAGGSNLEKIEESPYPLMVLSSSEIYSTGGLHRPSYNGVLEYVKKGIQKEKIGVIIPQNKFLTMEAFELDEGLQTIFKGNAKYNTPTLISPKVGSEGFKLQLHGLKRLQDRVISHPISITEKNNGFISMGGTGYHILKEVKAEKVPLETIVTNTFDLLKLSESSTKKAIFISKIKCPILKEDWLSGSYEKVALFASQGGQTILFSNPGLFGTSYHYITGGSLKSVPEDKALFMYYSWFATTLRSKGNEGMLEFFEFQKQFFGKTTSTSPLHEVFGFMIQASCDEQVEVSLGFQKLIQTLKAKGLKKELEFAKEFAQNLNLQAHIDLVSNALAPELIQKIQAGKVQETINYLKNRMKNTQDPLFLLNEPDLKGQTPLYWAIHLKQPEIIDFLT